ncbi:MAG: helix-turn-helix transcriptional regulator [Clostridia bacterium]|nr:helix-turn-helix transcriptional regulator [Clostridia bacterium]
MKHLIFFYHIAAFLVGMTVVIASAAAYLKFRKPVFKNYGLFVISLSFFMMDQTGAAYKLVSLVGDRYTDILLKLLSAVGYAIMTYSLPRFMHDIFGDEMDEKRKDLFSILALVLPVSAVILYYTMALWVVAILVFNGILIGTVVYAGWVVQKNAGTLQDSTKRDIIKRFKVLTLTGIPFILLDMVVEKMPVVGSYFPYGIFAVPTFYLLWNSLTLYYAFKYFDSDKFSSEELKNNTSENDGETAMNAFAERYGITSREKEVVALISKGLSYNRICEELVISMPTVKSHVYNIYQKTGVKNRIELINKIKDPR